MASEGQISNEALATLLIATAIFPDIEPIFEREIILASSERGISQSELEPIIWQLALAQATREVNQ